MSPRWIAAIAMTCTALAQPALASEQLAREKQCIPCHQVSAESEGPSFQNIALKWKGRKDAQKQLYLTFRKGTKVTNGPHWFGKKTMPDGSKRPPLNDAEAKELMGWILSQ